MRIGGEFCVILLITVIQANNRRTRLGFGKEMDLTVKDVKERILSRCDVEFAVEEFGVKLGNDLLGYGNRVASIVGLLRHARHVAHNALCVRFDKEKACK